MTVRTESGKIFQKRGLAVMDPFAPAGELFLSENPERCVFIPVISKYSRGKYRPGNSNVRNILVFPFAVEKCDGKMKFGIVAKSECGGQGQYVFCLLPTNRCRWKSVCGMIRNFCGTAAGSVWRPCVVICIIRTKRLTRSQC